MKSSLLLLYIYVACRFVYSDNVDVVNGLESNAVAEAADEVSDA